MCIAIKPFENKGWGLEDRRGMESSFKQSFFEKGDRSLKAQAKPRDCCDTTNKCVEP